MNIANALLPRDLSVWSMFPYADLIVRAVMIGLALASVPTWTVLLAKSLELARATRAPRHTRLVTAVITAAATLVIGPDRYFGAAGRIVRMEKGRIVETVDNPASKTESPAARKDIGRTAGPRLIARVSSEQVRT